MKGARTRNVAALLLALVLSAALPIASSRASEKPTRGDYPRCQDGCVGALKSRMADLSEEYKEHKDKLLYEERVEQARRDYDSCIDRCKIARPVK